MDFFDLPGPLHLFTVGGKARDDGFELSGTNAAGMAWAAQCAADPASVDADAWDGIATLTLVVLIAMALAAPFVRLFWMPVLCIGMALIAGPGASYRSWKQWHWVEHQVARLLEEKRTPSREALRRTSPVTMRCGSAQSILSVLQFAAVFAIFDYGFAGWLAFASVSLALFAVRSPRMELTRRGRIARAILVAVGSPAILCTLGFQRLLFLRRPTPEQEELAAAFGTGLAPFVALHTLQGARLLVAATQKRGALSITK